MHDPGEDRPCSKKARNWAFAVAASTASRRSRSSLKRTACSDSRRRRLIEDRHDSRQELLGYEGLDKIVIRPGFQPLNSTFLAGTAESMMTGRLAVAGSARSAAIKPSPSRRGIITSVRIRSGGWPRRARQRFFTVRHGIDLVMAEQAADVAPHVGVVIGDQHAGPAG